MKYIVEVKYTNPAHEHVSLRRRVDTINRVIEARNENEAINRVANQQRALGFLIREAKVIQPDVLEENANKESEKIRDRLRRSGETYSVPKNTLPNFSTPNRQNRKVTFGDVGGASNLPQNLPSEKDGTANILPYDPNKHKKDKKPKLAEGIGSLFSRKTGTKPTTPTYRGLPQSGKVVTPDGKHVGTIFPYQTRTQGPQFSFSDTHRETLKNDHGLSHDEISNQERDHHVIGKLNSGEWKIKKEEVEQIDELNYEYDMKRLPPKGFTVPHQQNPHLHYNPKTKEVHNTRTGTTYPDYGNEFVGYRMHMAREEVEEIDESKPFPSFVKPLASKPSDKRVSGYKMSPPVRAAQEKSDALSKPPKRPQAGTLAAKRMAEETEVQYIEEKLTVADPVSAWIKDFVNSDNPKFKGKSKKERIRMALGAYYAAQRDAQQETNEEAKNKYSEKEVKHAEKKQDKKKGSLNKIEMEPEMEMNVRGIK